MMAPKFNGGYIVGKSIVDMYLGVEKPLFCSDVLADCWRFIENFEGEDKEELNVFANKRLPLKPSLID